MILDWQRCMNLVDVTLRDGGFTCDFNWPIEFAQEYYNLMCELGVKKLQVNKVKIMYQ